MQQRRTVDRKSLGYNFLAVASLALALATSAHSRSPILTLQSSSRTTAQSPSPSPAPVPSTPAASQLVKTEYDSAKDITQISLNPFVLATSKLEELRLGAVAGYKGKVRTTPQDLILFFFSLTKTDQDKYETARKLAITADGQRFDLGETNRSKQSENGVFLETMAISVKTSDFLRISNAKEVKIKLGITEVDLTPEQIKILRFTASYLTE